MTDTSNADTAADTTSDAPVSSTTDTSPSVSPNDGGGGISPAPSPAQAPTGEPPQAEIHDESVLDLDLPAGMKSFDRSYVEKIRAEAAANRTKFREAETLAAERAAALERFSAFDGYSDDDMSLWTKMASDWKNENYTEVATIMQQIASNVLDDPNATKTERADAQAVLDDTPGAVDALTPDDIRRIAREESETLTEQRTAETKQKEAVEGVFKQIRDAGYADGTPQSFQVLWFANNRTDGDIGEAIKLQQAEEQSIIDRYVESLGKGGTPVRMPNLGGGGTPTTEPPKNMADARRQAQAFLDERAANRS